MREPPPSQGFASPVRRIHLGLSVLISVQLVCSLGMEAPEPGEKATQLAQLLFQIHRYVGTAALLFVTAQWIYVLRDRAELGRHLFPWGTAHRAVLAADLRAVARRELLQGGTRPGLPGLTHGLGLLAATGMVATGGVLFFAYPASGPIPSWVDLVADAHGLVANLVWVYWFGHVGMVLLHHGAGGDELRRMFRWRG